MRAWPWVPKASGQGIQQVTRGRAGGACGQGLGCRARCGWPGRTLCKACRQGPWCPARRASRHGETGSRGCQGLSREHREEGTPRLRPWRGAACRPRGLCSGEAASTKEADSLNGGCRQYVTANETIKHIISRCAVLAAADRGERRGQDQGETGAHGGG